MSIFSVVAVRKGSKGISNKCVRRIGGKAIFEYSIDYSIELNQILKNEAFTVVSSDYDIIKKYCSKNNICFVERIPSLASDIARIEDVIYDAYCKTATRDFEYISLLYGNIPIRYPEEFLKAYNFLMENKDYDAVLSMQNVEKFNPAWMFELNEDVLPVKKSGGYRRQDLKQFMIHDGHTILFRTGHFLDYMRKKSEHNIMYEAFGKKIKPMLNDKLILDIDTERDLKLAEAVLKFRKIDYG